MSERNDLAVTAGTQRDCRLANFSPPNSQTTAHHRAPDQVVLFHHSQGLTPGVAAFADELRAAAHTVHTPDLFDGRTFGSLEEGMGYVKQIGFGEIIERGVRAAEHLPQNAVYVGFSLRVLPAQKLAQTRAGAGRAPVPRLHPRLGVRRGMA